MYYVVIGRCLQLLSDSSSTAKLENTLAKNGGFKILTKFPNVPLPDVVCLINFVLFQSKTAVCSYWDMTA